MKPSPTSRARRCFVRRAPNDAHNLRLLGSSYADVGRNAEAIAHLEQALRLNPRLAEAHNDLGGVLFAERRGKEALAHFQQAAALSPQRRAPAFQSRQGARCARPAGGGRAQHSGARSHSTPSLPKPTTAWVWCCSRSDDVAEAIVHFKRAAALAPDSPDFQNDLGGALAQAGRVRRRTQARPSCARTTA